MYFDTRLIKRQNERECFVSKSTIQKRLKGDVVRGVRRARARALGASLIGYSLMCRCVLCVVRGSLSLRLECSVRRVRRVRRVAFVGCPVAPQARHAAAEGASVAARVVASVGAAGWFVGATVHRPRCHLSSSSCRMTSCSCLDSESPRRGMIIGLG